MDKDLLEHLGTKVGCAHHAYPGLTPITKKLADLKDQIAQLERDSQILAHVRATLLLNFGKGSPSNVYGLALTEEIPTMDMLLAVLEHLCSFVPNSGVGSKQDSQKEEQDG